MRNRDELTELFTTYFSDKLSPTQIDWLVSDVLAAGQPRQARTYAVSQPLTERTNTVAAFSQPAQVWSAALI